MEPAPPATVDPQDDEDARVEAIVRQGAAGTWALAGLSTFIVMAIYLLFYLFAYLPRGAVQ